jgi:hypothetical protein
MLLGQDGRQKGVAVATTFLCVPFGTYLNLYVCKVGKNTLYIHRVCKEGKNTLYVHRGSDYCILVTFRVTKSTLKRAHSNNSLLEKMTVTTVTGEKVLLYWILKAKIGYCSYSNWQPSLATRVSTFIFTKLVFSMT